MDDNREWRDEISRVTTAAATIIVVFQHRERERGDHNPFLAKSIVRTPSSEHARRDGGMIVIDYV